ncbi:MAG: trypsin-like peptidase domain-containing protein [Bacteroidia bacterium]|nr:trypsin-like peptidase domain-containing protein [Bacteroidia bacterium]
MKKTIGTFLIAAFGAAVGAGAIVLTQENQPPQIIESPVQRVNLTTSTGAHVVETPDFVQASSLSTPAVVHIKSSYGESQSTNDPWKDLFGFPGQMGPRQSAGSGVIISQDGYIATNNHVIDDAKEIEVVLQDKRTFKGTVVGADPTTDLALVKIEEAGLPFLEFGNSDQVQIGEWVLAVGNPFNLTSTVTAGIVSAKGRSLNLLKGQNYSIESFIQTDAAVNPGNSGGALINTKGQLVGINTAIASETGSYAGYSFAVPSNLVRKIVADLKEFGTVQKGILGVQIRDIDQVFAKDKDLATLEGVYVDRVLPNGAAASSGIESGDVIVSIDGIAVGNTAELQEVIGQKRPGDEVAVNFYRGDNLKSQSVKLRNLNGETRLVKKDEIASSKNMLGGEIVNLTSAEKSKLGIRQGVKVRRIDGGVLKKMEIPEGFIITKLNRKPVDSIEEVEKAMDNADGRVTVEGYNPEGEKEFHSFGF